MTIKFGNFANFIVRNFVVIWEAPTLGFEESNLRCPGNFAGMSRTPGGVLTSLTTHTPLIKGVEVHPLN